MSLFHLSHTDLDGYAAQFVSKFYFQNIKFFNSNYGKEIDDKFELILSEANSGDIILITDLKEGKLIDEIYLEKEFRNTGIGTDIIREMLEKNRNIYLWVYKENKKAISLYNRLGFIIVDETDSRYYMKYDK